MNKWIRMLCAGLIMAPLLVSAAERVDPSWRQVSEIDRRALSPEIAVGPDGSVNVIWLDKGLAADRPAPKPHVPGEHSHRSSTELYFSRSTDKGASWTTPVRVNDEPGSVWGFAVSKPRIAVGKSGTIHIFFPGNERSPATGLDVVTARYTRSTDGGKTFEPAKTINRPADFDRTDMLGENLSATFSFGTMGLAPDGTVVALWQDVGEMQVEADGADAHMAVSRDDGKTFSAERAAIATNTVCPCCQLTVAFGANDMYVGYRKIYADGRDSTVARSIDGGQSIAGEGRLPFAKWDINGCPLKPTELAVDGNRVYAAAYTGGEDPAGLYFARSEDNGKNFAGRIQVHPEAAYSDAAELTVGPDGLVRVIWQAKIDGPRRLFLAESGDHGETLSQPMEIATPAGNSAYPATAVGPNGTVYLAWEQEGEQVFVTAIPNTRVAVVSR